MISLNLRLQSMLLDQDTTIPNQFVTELEGICITLKREDCAGRQNDRGKGRLSAHRARTWRQRPADHPE